MIHGTVLAVASAITGHYGDERMKLEDCKKMEKGTRVTFSYNGFRWQGVYKGLVECSSGEKMTAEQLFSKKTDWIKVFASGRKHMEAVIDYMDDFGRPQIAYVLPRWVERLN